MQKTELRKMYLEKRKALSNDEVLLLSEKIFEQFCHHFSLDGIKNVHVFLPIQKLNEVNTRLFIDHFWAKGISVFVPKIKDGKMISLPYTRDTELVENAWGIIEPLNEDYQELSFDMVLTPLLYADSQGNRIGYGKGFYDYFFKNLKDETIKIGLGFFEPKEAITDVSAEDVRLDYLVTPDDKLSFDFTSISTK